MTSYRQPSQWSDYNQVSQQKFTGSVLQLKRCLKAVLRRSRRLLFGSVQCESQAHNKAIKYSPLLYLNIAVNRQLEMTHTALWSSMTTDMQLLQWQL